MASIYAETDCPLVNLQRTSSQNDIWILYQILFLNKCISTSPIFTLPLKVDKKGFGFSKANYRLTEDSYSSGIYLRWWRCSFVFLSLRLVSPSRFLVSMKAVFCYLLWSSKMMSHGKYWSFLTRIMCPTCKTCHCLFANPISAVNNST